MLTDSICGESRPSRTSAVSGLEFSREAWPSYSMTTEVTALSMSWPAKLPIWLASPMYGRSFGISSALTEGRFSAFTTVPEMRKSASCSATCSATFSCASVVEAPRWGVATTCSMPNSTLSFAGSLANTSRAAPATWPLSSPAFRSASTTRAPRAQFTMRTPGFILAMLAALMIPRVASVAGACRLMKSERANRVSRSTFSTARSSARSGVR